jgi:hypothetical protein
MEICFREKVEGDIEGWVWGESWLLEIEVKRHESVEDLEAGVSESEAPGLGHPVDGLLEVVPVFGDVGRPEEENSDKEKLG